MLETEYGTKLQYIIILSTAVFKYFLGLGLDIRPVARASGLEPIHNRADVLHLGECTAFPNFKSDSYSDHDLLVYLLIATLKIDQ